MENDNDFRFMDEYAGRNRAARYMHEEDYYAREIMRRFEAANWQIFYYRDDAYGKRFSELLLYPEIREYRPDFLVYDTADRFYGIVEVKMDKRLTLTHDEMRLQSRLIDIIQKTICSAVVRGNLESDFFVGGKLYCKTTEPITPEAAYVAFSNMKNREFKDIALKDLKAEGDR